MFARSPHPLTPTAPSEIGRQPTEYSAPPCGLAVGTSACFRLRSALGTSNRFLRVSLHLVCTYGNPKTQIERAAPAHPLTSKQRACIPRTQRLKQCPLFITEEVVCTCWPGLLVSPFPVLPRKIRQPSAVTFTTRPQPIFIQGKRCNYIS